MINLWNYSETLFINNTLSIINYNWFIFMPEIFLTLSIILLIVYGVIFSKINDNFNNKINGKISGIKKIINIGILILIITLIILNYLNKNIENITNGTELYNMTGPLDCLKIDPLIIGVKNIIIISGILILILTQGVVIKKREKLIDYELTILMLLSILGMLLLISGKDLIIMYLSIETLSLSLYILAGIRKTGQYSTEAGLKYFILGALSSGMLLFGSALIYISTGLTDFDSLASLINNNNQLINETLIGYEIGAVFILFAIFFKLAIAPFHMWAPDVYEGSPTIITAFFAIVPKIAILILLISLIFGPFFGIFNSIIKPLLIISALLSIMIGSLGALNQTKIKRLFAYSAIGHIGFIILGLVPGTINSLQSSLIYIVLYIIMSLNTFSFILLYYNKYSSNSISKIEKKINNKKTIETVYNPFNLGSFFISELSGLSRKEPLLAITFSLGLLSIAGIPPLAGFFSKYYILLSIIEDSLNIVAIITILFSVIACFYYIRLIQFMFFKNSTTYAIKDLADIAYSKIDNNSLYFKHHSFYNINGFHLSSLLILASTFYFIISFIFFPQPLLMWTFDTILNTFI